MRNEVSSSHSQKVFQVVQDEAEREAYLILIVHGIGSNTETQTQNLSDFEKSLSELIKGGFVNSEYTFETFIIDWKTLVDESDIRKRMKKCQISANSEREMFNMTAPDIIQYLNADY